MNPRARRRALIRLLSRAARSGFRRYPRVVAESLSAPRAGNAAGAADLRAIADHPFAASWLGHASVVWRQGGSTLAIDPVLSERIGLRVGKRTVGPRRLIPIPAEPDALPPIDTLLISHAHYDHLDRATLTALASTRTTVITARATRRLVPRGFRAVIELDWDQEVTLDRVTVRAVRPNHWGARFAVDRTRGFNSYLVTSDDRRVLAAGDTAFTRAFRDLGPVDLALFGIGAYDPWEHAHATPEQAWTMFRGVRGRYLFPIHHSTFELSEEHPDEPMQRLVAAAGPEHHRIIRAGPGLIWAPESEIHSIRDKATAHSISPACE